MNVIFRKLLLAGVASTILFRGALIIVEVPMFYPSSKLCSCCGWKNIELKLSDRSWTCQECDTLHDRDVNAAINLRNYAASYAVKASEEISSGLLAA